MNPLLIASLISGGSSLLGGLLGNGSSTASQIPLETPEQSHARMMLEQFAKTGVFGDFKAGAEVPLQYGDFNATPQENAGLSQLDQLLQSGIPDQFKLGDETLKGLMGGTGDQVAAQFEPYKATIKKQIQQSSDDLKRNAAFGGSLYSTDTIARLGKIQSAGNDTLAGQLAALTNGALDRSASLIPQAYASGNAQEGIRQGRIGASQTYGSLRRNLNTASASARDTETLRRRQESTMPLDALRTIAGSNSQFGVPSVSVPNQSPFQGVLNTVSQIGGNYVGNSLFLNQYQNMLKAMRASNPSAN